MRRLIYTTAYGKEINSHIAAECVHAIRKFGFRDDLVVLCDHDEVFESARTVTFRYASRRLPRCLIHELMDLEKYDQVMYLDADVLNVGDLDPVFGLLSDAPEGLGVVLPNEDFMIGEMFLNHMLLTGAERNNLEIMRRRQINSGTILMRGKDAPSILSTWETLWASNSLNGYWDQPALQALIVRNEFWGKAIPDDLYFFPMIPLDKPARELSRQTRLIHFNGPIKPGTGHKEKVLKVMEEINLRDTLEQIPASCAWIRENSEPIRRPKSIFEKLGT